MSLKVGLRVLLYSWRNASLPLILVIVALLLPVVFALYLWVYVQASPVLLQGPGGLIVTGMSDSVPWGLYISFFIFWVGIAAASIICAVLAYIFGFEDFNKLVPLAEAQAVSALIAAFSLVLVDIGRPIRTLLLMPMLPNMLSVFDWDFIVLIAYLVLNILGLLYGLGSSSNGCWPRLARSIYIGVAAPLAIGIHTVTAFILQPLSARPYWNTPILAPEFVATAFASGSSMLVLALAISEKCVKGFSVKEQTYRLLSRVALVSLIAALYLLFSEVQEAMLYPGEPMRRRALTLLLLRPCCNTYMVVMEWLWISLGVAAVVYYLATVGSSSRSRWIVTSMLVLASILCQKTLPLMVAGFTPTPFGTLACYNPTPVEISITLGVTCLALLVYVVLAKPVVELAVKR